jgi:hypothetical protein
MSICFKKNGTNQSKYGMFLFRLEHQTIAIYSNLNLVTGLEFTLSVVKSIPRGKS